MFIYFIKKNILCFCFVVFLGLNLQSQNTRIDSLKRELLLHTEQDTIRINLLNDLAFSSYRKDINITLSYLKEAEKLSETIDYKKGKAKSIYIKGVTEVIQSNFAPAVSLFENAIDVYNSIDAKKGVSACYNGLGIAFYYQGNYTKSIEYYEKSLVIDKEIGDKKSIAAAMTNLGSSYADIGKYPEAIDYYQKGLKINQELNNKTRISNCLNNLGTVYDDQGNIPLALKCYRQSLFISEEMGDSLGIAKSLNNIGVTYKHQEKYDKALAFYKKSLAIHERNKNKKNIAQIKNNIGNIYKHKKDYNTALSFLKESLKISQEINDLDNVSRCFNNIGNVYDQTEQYNLAMDYYTKAKIIKTKIGDQSGLCDSYLGLASTLNSQKNYVKALSYALKSEELSQKLKLLNSQRDVRKLLSQLYKNTGDYEKSLANHELYKTLNDSVFNKKNIDKLAQIEYEYKYKQELDSASLRELKLTKTVKTTSKNLETSQRNSFIAIIVILLISIVSGAFIFILKLRHVNAKNQNILIEQKLLRSQMTPHFIFNSLSVLQGMILNKEEGQSISYLSKFSKLLRTILENSRHKAVLLSNELSAIDSYMALHNLDAKPPYDYFLSIDESVNINQFKIPPMLIQPFIENAIEHAFGNKTRNKEIKVDITFKNSILKCTIADNGKGINTDSHKIKTDKNSLATTITSERLKILSNDFNMQGSLDIKNRALFNEQGTLVTLIIPYKTTPI